MDGLQHLRIPAGQRYQSPGEAFVEGDASSASYFLAGALSLPTGLRSSNCLQYNASLLPCCCLRRKAMLIELVDPLDCFTLVVEHTIPVPELLHDHLFEVLQVR